MINIASLLTRLTERAYDEVMPQPPGDTRPIYNVDKDLVDAITMIDRLYFAIRRVHDTFKRDMEQGFKTRDKEFAVAVLGNVLVDQPSNADIKAILTELIDCYGSDDGGGPIALIELAKAMRDKL